MYNSNTNNLIIVDAHLTTTKKKKGFMCNLFLWLILFILSKNLAFICFFFHVQMRQPDPLTTQLAQPIFNPFKMAHFLTRPIRPQPIWPNPNPTQLDCLPCLGGTHHKRNLWEPIIMRKGEVPHRNSEVLNITPHLTIS